MTYRWGIFNSSKEFDLRAFPPGCHDGSLARISSDDNEVFELWIPNTQGMYADCTPLETDDNLTLDDLKSLAAVLLAAKENT